MRACFGWHDVNVPFALFLVDLLKRGSHVRRKRPLPVSCRGAEKQFNAVRGDPFENAVFFCRKRENNGVKTGKPR